MDEPTREKYLYLFETYTKINYGFDAASVFFTISACLCVMNKCKWLVLVAFIRTDIVSSRVSALDTRKSICVGLLFMEENDRWLLLLQLHNYTKNTFGFFAFCAGLCLFFTAMYVYIYLVLLIGIRD